MQNKKALIIINEPFGQMILGRNTSLSYIAALIKKKFDVYICNLQENFPLPLSLDGSVSVQHLSPKNSQIMLEKFVEENGKLLDFLDQNQAVKNFSAIAPMQVVEISDEKFLQQLNKKTAIKLSEIDFIVQRLEPMKWPFPPAGKEKIDEVIILLKKLFPKLIFQAPINKNDKKFPLELQKLYPATERLATPTIECNFDDKNILEQAKEMGRIYIKTRHEAHTTLWGSTSCMLKHTGAKIVIKPQDSAQGLGIFCVEFKEDGRNLQQIKNAEISQLSTSQIFEIDTEISTDDFKEIVEILCLSQAAHADAELFSAMSKKNDRRTINALAKNFYGEKLLIQPFLEGVKFGDVRVNLIKNRKGDFAVAACVFRKSVAKENQFTTCLTAGGSVLQPIAFAHDNENSIINENEQNDLAKKVNFIVQILNNDAALRKEYENILELGCDFILTGDNKTVLLGEINHHCPALLPQGEAIKFSKHSKNLPIFQADFMPNYQGGIAAAASLIDTALALTII